MFPPTLELGTFRFSNGEFGWTRDQIPRVVPILIEHNLAILGGELWWIPPGADTFSLVPQADGTTACYTWTTKEKPGECWADFVRRSAAESLAAVEKWPRPGERPADLRGRILYNLTWVSEEQYAELDTA
jgi:hypothetical protein